MWSSCGMGRKPDDGCLKALVPSLNFEAVRADTAPMTNPFFQMGAVFAALVIACLAAFGGRDVGASMGLVEADPTPVLVFAIPGAGALERVRAAIPDDRVLLEDEAGFAHRKGRIYVRHVASAGPLINRGGWVDRPIQIVSLGEDDAQAEGTSPGGSALSPEQRMARLRQLVHKKSLTRGEQVFVLQAMNDGLEI